MNKLKIEYKKNGKSLSREVSSSQLKKILKDVVKIEICTRSESFEIKDSIYNFLKNYKKHSVKNLSKKYNASQATIKNKLFSLGITSN